MKSFWSGVLGGYRRYLSPHKGFCCAHAVYHQGPSCSWAIEAILCEQGLWRGWPRIRARLRACRAAATILRAAAAPQRRPGAPKATQSSRCGRACDRLELAEACSCLPDSCDFTP